MKGTLNTVVLDIHAVSTLFGIYLTHFLDFCCCSLLREVYLHTTVLMCGYLCYSQLPSFDQSGHSPLTYFH